MDSVLPQGEDDHRFPQQVRCWMCYNQFRRRSWVFRWVELNAESKGEVGNRQRNSAAAYAEFVRIGGKAGVGLWLVRSKNVE